MKKTGIALCKFAYNFAMDEVIGRIFDMIKIQILFPVLLFSALSWLFGLLLGYFIWG